MTVYFGSHVPFEKTLLNTIRNGFSNQKVIQFFLGNKLSLTRTKIKDEDLKKSREYLDSLQESNIKSEANSGAVPYLFTHAPYTHNLCGSVSNLGDPEKIRITIDSLSYEMEIMSNFQGRLETSLTNSGVVVHPGTFPKRLEGLDQIVKTINEIPFKENYRLLLENSAGQGNSLCTTIEELKYIYDRVNSKSNVGFCIDTCHLFAVGDYDISKVEEVDRFFNDFHTQIGLEKLWLIHLNDSKEELGSCKDRHANLGEGHIFEGNEDYDALKRIISICEAHTIPIVLETKDTIGDLTLLQGLA